MKPFAQAVFEKAGFTPDGAEHQADVLIWANLRGVDSHGVQCISWYLELVDKGHMKPSPEHPDGEGDAGDVLDRRRFRAWAGRDDPRHEVGDSEGATGRDRLGRHPQHASPGAIGYYALMAANENMAGLAIVFNPPNMAPHGARGRRRAQQPHRHLRAGQAAAGP